MQPEGLLQYCQSIQLPTLQESSSAGAHALMFIPSSLFLSSLLLCFSQNKILNQVRSHRSVQRDIEMHLQFLKRSCIISQYRLCLGQMNKRQAHRSMMQSLTSSFSRQTDIKIIQMLKEYKPRRELLCQETHVSLFL